jgi:1-acyl-sn-glycerol-3-phosphate acyltransferase
VYSCPVLKLNIINSEKESHLKPAILISNHQSMLDIIMLLALGPKMIIVTKGWVWNNPLLGKVARYADYYCADDGYDNLAKGIGDKLAKGYSVIIFPEGKRSFTGEIDRFHKGAFYLAEKLQADILPVVIRGTMDSVRRGTRLIKKSRIVLKYLPRIRISDEGFGENYTDKSKNIRHYMISEYEKI